VSVIAKTMRDDQHKFLMLLGRLPARLTAERRLIFDVKQAQRVGLVACAQAGLFAGGGVLGVINAGALKQDEPIFHVMTFGSEA
jgi:hypothetical protein